MSSICHTESTGSSGARRSFAEAHLPLGARRASGGGTWACVSVASCGDSKVKDHPQGGSGRGSPCGDGEPLQPTRASEEHKRGEEQNSK